MVSPKKKGTVTSKTVVSKALHKLRMVSPDVDTSGKYIGSMSEYDLGKRTKKSFSDGTKRKRSGSIINSIKNPFSTREQYHLLAAAVNNERNTMRPKVSSSSHSDSKARLHVPRVPSREHVSAATSLSSRRSEMLHSPYDHDLSALEKGELQLHREQSPLIPDHVADSTNYQSFVHVEQQPVITQGSMPMTPIPLPGHGSIHMTSQMQQNGQELSCRKTHLNRFLTHLYEKYPSYLTGFVVILMFAGSMYSISTGKGTRYITAAMKATLCWLLGSNTADLIFGDGFCEFDFQGHTQSLN
ncbi:HEL235Cp [Eremothecium sinecaudum]|uniref:HEL235Cp n=1 Tax=Eremothecium sinecaudum TaxID=45286 RepID=A0A120K2C0_9SACH|nr:HEL235Cp [Eremothecium sinecaudum]AMD21046.1 HEL235Cp [Eremothecium sinecaudum]